MASDSEVEPDGAPDRPDGSFDPRTWLKSGAPPETTAAPTPTPTPTDIATAPAANPGAEDAEASFDPRSWGGPVQADASARPLEPGPATAATPAAPRPPSRRLLLIGSGAAVLAAGAGAAWWFTGRRASAPAPAAAEGGEGGRASPAAAAAATASVQRQAMTLDGPGSIQAALSAQGLKPAAASGAARAALGALAGATGEMRLDLATLKPPPGAPSSQEASLVSMQVRRPDGSGVSVAPKGDSYVAAVIKAVTHAAVQVVRGQVDAESFYTSAVSAGLSDALIPDFFQAFVYDFDFQREIEAGAVFEAAIGGDVTDQGAAVGKRKLLYAGMTTAKKSLALYRYDAPGAAPTDPPWYDGEGRSIKKGLMRTPVEGARISSSFGWRVHPILGFQKLHKGTDFAAPVGTPIYAAGDGVVEWAAMKGPNGNLTILKHDNGWETYYLHQNAFAPGIAPGVRVRQAQNIGWVGTTGRSTGPHLHYELHINGEAVDAMAQPLDSGETLKGEALAGFLKQRDTIDKLRASNV